MSGIAATMRRPSDGRMLLGVCAAVAKRFEVDPVLVRIVAVIGLFTLTTPVLVAYAGLALVVPRDDGRMLIGGDPGDRRESLIGWGVVIAASALVIATPSIVAGDEFGAFEVGLLLIAAAVIGYAMSKSGGGQSARPASGGAPAPAAAVVPTTRGGGEPAEAATEPLPETLGAPSPPRRRREKAPSLFAPLAAMIIGVLGFGAVIVSVFDLDLTPVTVAVVCGSLAVLCGGVAIASVDRRGLVPLLLLGTLFAVLAAGVAIGRDEFDRGIGYREYEPLTAAEIEEGYEIGMGFVEIDLRSADLPAGETVMPLHVGFGAAEVTLPGDLQVVSTGEHVNGDVAAMTGEAEATGGAGEGSGGSVKAREPVLVLDGDVEAGAIELRRPGADG